LKRFSKRTLIGLLVCSVVLVGAVGAYAYMLNNQKSTGLRAVVNGYVLEIDKAVYKRGELVRITFRNNGDQTVEFASAGWYIIRNSEGRQVAIYTVELNPLSPSILKYLSLTFEIVD